MSDSLGSAPSIGRSVPPLAHMARFRSAAVVELEIQRLVQLTPSCVAHIPETLYVVTTDSIISTNATNRPSCPNLFSYWCRVHPVKALASFSRQHPPHPITAQLGRSSLPSFFSSAFNNFSFLLWLANKILCSRLMVQLVSVVHLGCIVEFIKVLAQES
jgi:hypothetical protein